MWNSGNLVWLGCGSTKIVRRFLYITKTIPLARGDGERRFVQGIVEWVLSGVCM